MTTKADTLSGIARLECLADRGGRFCLLAGRSQNYLPDNRQTTPHTLADVRHYAESGGNVGLLTGEQTVAMLGDLTQTVKVVPSRPACRQADPEQELPDSRPGRDSVTSGAQDNGSYLASLAG